MPLLKATVSANPYAGIWQLAQLIDESFERIFSLKSCLPSAVFVLIELIGEKEKWIAADARMKKKMAKDFFIGQK